MTDADRGDASGTETAERAAGVIDRYAPRSLSAPAARFAREVAAVAAPQTPARAKALLFAAGRLGGFGESTGAERSQVRASAPTPCSIGCKPKPKPRACHSIRCW